VQLAHEGDSWSRFLVMTPPARENSRSLAQVATDVAGMASKRGATGFLPAV